MKIIKRMLLVITLLMGIVALTGCIGESPTPELVTINVISDNKIINTLIKNKGDKLTTANFSTIKEGYEFAGMYLDSDFTSPFELPYTVDSNLSIYLKWEIKKYTVTWKDSDGSILKTDSNVNYDSMPQYDGTTPSKEGYTFIGWTPTLNKVTQDATYTATYQKNDEEVQTFVVGFYDGDSLIKEETLDYGSEVVFETPVKSGYTFKGWLYNNKLVTTKMIVTANLKFVASWELIVDGAVAKLDNAYNSLATLISNPENITADFNVPTMTNGVTLAWSASGSNVVTFEKINANSSKAVINRPQAGSNDAIVTLTAVLTIKSEIDPTKTLTKTWTINITIKSVETDGAIAKLDNAYNSLATLISDPENITADFNVPTMTNGITLAWSASGSSVSFEMINANSSKAVINRPLAGSNDAIVTLTAVLTIKSEIDPTKTLTKTWTITIKVIALSSDVEINNVRNILDLTDPSLDGKSDIILNNVSIFALGTDVAFGYDGTGIIQFYGLQSSVVAGRVYKVTGTLDWYFGIWRITSGSVQLESSLTFQTPEQVEIDAICDKISELDAGGARSYVTVEDGNFEPIYAKLTGKVYLIPGDESNNNTFIIDTEAQSLTAGTTNTPASGFMLYYKTLNFDAVKQLDGLVVTLDVVIHTYQSNNLAFAIYCVGIQNNFTDYETLFEGNWNRPGLYNKDGSVHQMPNEIVKTGQIINVNNYGAKANDAAFDNQNAFKNAIAAAKAGDEVFVPEGTYYFTSRNSSISAYYTHIALKDGIIFSGAGVDKTILVSAFSQTDNRDKQTTVIAVVNSKNIVIKDMTITSATPDSQLPDPNNSTINSGIYTAPKYGISIESNGTVNTNADQTSNVVVKDVLVEKFQRMGVRIKNAREITVKTSVFQKAVDLAGGGAGYGVCIQGSDWGVDWTDTTKDTYWNLVTDNFFKGPYLRHGALIQYHAHNNAVLNNKFEGTLLDAIDMHGEDEYSNEIAYNQILNTRAGAAVGVGNSGATHDAAGRNNYIHNNLIDGGRRGIDVILGTPQTVIKDNVIKNLIQDGSIGITLSDAPTTYIIGNTFENIKSTKEGYGIKVSYYYNSENPQQGVPSNLKIVNNSFDGVSKGVYVQTHDDNYLYQNNTFTASVDYDYLNEKETFKVPEKSSLTDEVTGYSVAAIESTYVTTNSGDDLTNGTLKLRSSSNGTNNRMVYMKFDVTTKPSTYQRVYLSFTARPKDGILNLNFWATTTFTNWTTQTINWSNARLKHPTIAKVEISDDSQDQASLIYNFKFPNDLYEYVTYYIDITDYMLGDLDSDIFTVIISNDAMESKYVDMKNHLASNNQNLRLIFT